MDDTSHEAEPRYGVAETVARDVRRVLAANPGPMTFQGTNSYLVEQGDGLALIDPGPDLPEHTAALLRSAAGRLRRILVTHSHVDHIAAVATMVQATGAAVFGWHQPVGRFRPDHGLVDGDRIGGVAGSLVAVHTPGHAGDHLCFRGTGPDGLLFTGDHVMGWSTSVVSPPDGAMSTYMSSLRLLLTAPDRLYLPGHGPMVTSPHSLVRGMLAHRLARERAIMAALATEPLTTAALLAQLYGTLDLSLRPAAERVILAHLLKLQEEGRVATALDGQTWHSRPCGL